MVTQVSGQCKHFIETVTKREMSKPRLQAGCDPTLTHRTAFTMPNLDTSVPAALDGTIGNESRLLRLPAKIRNTIYHMVLVDDTPVYIKHRAAHSTEMSENRRQPGLLRVGRQIRQEASPIYYGMNTFYVIYVVQWPPAKLWIDSFGTDRIRLLRDVRQFVGFTHDATLGKRRLEREAVKAMQRGLPSLVEAVRVRVAFVMDSNEAAWVDQAELQAGAGAGRPDHEDVWSRIE